jgi:GntR family transcriptional regulator/MocR family aminotransferase
MFTGQVGFRPVRLISRSLCEFACISEVKSPTLQTSMTGSSARHSTRAVDLLLILDRDRPLRLQLERQLRDGIRSGRLQSGLRLPASRALAAELGISRGVVVEAYTQLTAEGYLETSGSGGTRVACHTAQPARPEKRSGTSRMRFDLRAGLPDTALFPRRVWSAAACEVLRTLPDAALLYGSPKGQPRLREAIVAYLGRARAIAGDEEETFITCGASHAFALLWSALHDRGVTRVAHEDPAWERIPKTIMQAGLEPVAVPVDARGLSVAELARSGAKVVIVSPAHQYPTGVIMHPARRDELIRWARESDGLIIEDDYDAEYRFDSAPIAPLRSDAPDCVAYVGTTSKILAPALRLGWMLVPSHLASAVAAAHAVSYVQPSVTNQGALATLLENGDIDRHLRRARNAYKARRLALLSAIRHSIPELRVRGAAAGLHLIAWLSPHVREEQVVAEAAKRGVALDGLHTACSVNMSLPPALVLGYGAIAESAIPEAVSHLADCLRESGGSDSAYVAA